jgi:putative addiction module component (TIGR02574 family)
MSRETTDLLKQALTLPVAERAELAGFLIESLDNTKDESIEGAWNEEIARRMGQLDSGQVEPISLEEFQRRLSSAVE